MCCRIPSWLSNALLRLIGLDALVFWVPVHIHRFSIVVMDAVSSTVFVFVNYNDFVVVLFGLDRRGYTHSSWLDKRRVNTTFGPMAQSKQPPGPNYFEVSLNPGKCCPHSYCFVAVLGFAVVVILYMIPLRRVQEIIFEDDRKRPLDVKSLSRTKFCGRLGSLITIVYRFCAPSRPPQTKKTAKTR